MAIRERYFGDASNVVHLICKPGVFYALYGEGGDDVISTSASTGGLALLGGDGDDWLNAGSFSNRHGSNVLNGGPGQDTLVGSSDREYFVCGADSLADVIIDRTVGDRDIVSAEGTYKLGINLECLWLSGEGHFRGAGNELHNTLKGNFGHNVLAGGGGRDTLSGGGGLDTLVGGRGADTLLLDWGPTIACYGHSRESVPGRFDTIMSLRANDRIDLSGIDADSGSTATREGFVFVGDSAFSANATAQIRYEVVDAFHTMLYISTDADADAEMQIELFRPYVLSAENFIL